MSSKAQMYSNDKTSSKQRSPNPATRHLPVAHRQTHPAAIIQRARFHPGSLTPSDVLQLQRTIGNRAVGRLLAQTAQCQPIQKKENRTGLPDHLKAGVENLSGISMDDVKVHYNSDKPAGVQALAYTQGTEIHVGPGKEKHLPHEAWHAVQQKQGRVKPTIQAQGVSINDDTTLEREADVMGMKALRMRCPYPAAIEVAAQATTAVQRAGETTATADVQGETIGTCGEKVRLDVRSSGGLTAAPQSGVSRGRIGEIGIMQTVPLSPHHNTVVQPMIKIKHLYRSLMGNKVPEGVEERKVLGGGYGVGYNSLQKRVVLYDSEGVIAHVEIKIHPESDSISLHTGTDRGEIGGQGHMMAMFPEALKIVYEKFRDFKTIEMAPAPGAATKGLISQLSQLRLRVEPPQLRQLGPTRMEMAGRFMETAANLRRTRKEREKREEKKEREAQAWDPETMLETTHELNALREMEAESSTGLHIMGVTPQFYEQLVGTGSPLLEGGAFKWYRSATEKEQGVLTIRIPMAAVSLYIDALSKLGTPYSVGSATTTSNSNNNNSNNNNSNSNSTT